MQLRAEFPHVKFRFSFPRLQVSEGQEADCRTEDVTTSDLQKAITYIRLTFPKDNLVLTGRENVNFLCESASIVNILGYAGQTSVGGYTLNKGNANQFTLDKYYNFDTFVSSLKKYAYEIL